MWRKTRAFFGPAEIPNNLSYSMTKRESPGLSLAFMEYHMLWPLALLGMAVGHRAWRETSLIYLCLGTYAASTIAFIVLTRLRQPAIPPLALFAGLAIAWWWDMLQARKWLRAGLAMAGVLALALYLKPVERLRATDYAMAAAAHFSLAQDLEAAAAWPAARHHYLRALALNPEHAEARARALALARPPARPADADLAAIAKLAQQARRAYEAGEVEAAIKMLEGAARRSPELALPRHYLANIHYQERELEAAELELEAAIMLEPGNALFARNLLTLRAELQRPQSR
jgi:tetratricopeptide (TPR) repeat protein